MAIIVRKPNNKGLVKSEGSKLRSENKKLKERIEELEKQLSIHDVNKIVICENCNNWGDIIDEKGVRNICKECE